MQKLDLKKPKTDIFDRLEYKDVFDRIELPTEEKVAYSDTMKEVLREEFQKLIASLPIPAMLASAMEKVATDGAKKRSALRDATNKTISDIRDQIDKLDSAHKKDREEAIDKLRNSLDDLRNEVRQPRYEFGGYPLTNGGLPFSNWRFVDDGTNLSVQKKVNDVWTEVFAFTPNT